MQLNIFVHTSWWNFTDNITAGIGNSISSAMSRSRHIEDLHIAVFNITQYELVPAPEFPGTPLATYQRDRRWDKSWFGGVFVELFETWLNLKVCPGLTVYHRLTICSTKKAKNLPIQHENFHIFKLELNTNFSPGKKIDYFRTRLYNGNNIKINASKIIRWLRQIVM